MHKPVNTAGFLGNPRCFVVEDCDELRADAFALGLRIGDADQLIEEALARVHGHDVEAEFLAQVLLDADKFILAQDAIVDEDAGQLAADGLVDQHCGDRRIHAAGETADDVSRAHFFTNSGDGGFNEVGGRPVACRAADVEDEVLDELRPKRCVVHLGMKLHGPDAAFFVGDGGQRV